MANTYDPQDVYAIVNDLLQQAYGDAVLRVVDTSTLVAAGQIGMAAGYEPLLNAISNVVGKTLLGNRRYVRKFSKLFADSARWGAIVRKIKFLSTDFEASDDMPQDLQDGETVDMYEINNPKAIQVNIIGQKKLQKHITRYRDQMAQAFHSEAEFMNFIEGVMVEFNNDLESAAETEARATVVNYAAGCINMNYGNVIHMLTEFNTANGTEYTAADVTGKAAVMEGFVKYMAARVKEVSDLMTERSELFHFTPSGVTSGYLLRFTPKDRQRLYMFNPMQTKAEANVYSTVFNPQYLGVGEFEPVNFWQSIKAPMSIKVTPNQLTAAGASATGTQVTSTVLLGVLVDDETLGVFEQFDYASVTPFNSAGGYWNLYQHYRRNTWCDYTENGVVFLLD